MEAKRVDGSERIKRVAKQQTANTDDQALRLLQLEADVRRCDNLRVLIHQCANETRGLLGFRQAFLLRRRGGTFRVEAVSSVSVVDRNAPMIRQVEASLRNHGQPNDMSDISVSDADFAFHHLLWIPFVSKKGTCFAGLLIASERPFSEKRRALAKRLGATYAHAWLALTKGAVTTRRPVTGRVAAILVLTAVAALTFVQVPITAIAPVEVVAREARVVTAPLEGVVKEVVVRPNAPVAVGDLLVRFDDTELRNASDIARQNVVVAQSRVDALSTGAFGDQNARRDVAIARAELALAQAEEALAAERLSRTEIRSDVAGLAVFNDASSWRGRPVGVGEKILEVADPSRVEYAIALPVDDLIALDDSRPVRVFLDNAPLEVREANLIRAAYHAEMQGDGLLAFDLRARDQTEGQTPRIGARGTAQVMGRDARLGFVLFRRPIAWMRQTFGI